MGARHDWFDEIDNWYGGKRVFLKSTTWPAQDASQTSRLIMELVKPPRSENFLIVRDYVKV
ncbi:hypothetical protein AAVH_17053 [Aphelenchoides avenae]|nr:hypothetical protein AAVH_17053 [Aphelenchus avenae]